MAAVASAAGRPSEPPAHTDKAAVSPSAPTCTCATQHAQRGTARHGGGSAQHGTAGRTRADGGNRATPQPNSALPRPRQAGSPGGSTTQRSWHLAQQVPGWPAPAPEQHAPPTLKNCRARSSCTSRMPLGPVVTLELPTSSGTVALPKRSVRPS